jgi:hypothetical protein
MTTEKALDMAQQAAASRRLPWLVILLTALSGCSQPAPNRRAAVQSMPMPSRKVAVPSATVITTWFDSSTARDLMASRAEFDAAEVNAVAEFDRALGEYHEVVMLPAKDYENQVVGREVQITQNSEWRDEQHKRAGPAWIVRNRRIDSAEATLKRKTLASLKAFFGSELRAARISATDYRRFAGVDLEANAFPSIRRRKWSGPAVYAFNPSQRFTPEYVIVLQEVRKLWQAQANAVAISWTEPDPTFYGRLGVERP